MRLAGMEPGAVICEILGEDGMAARGADLLAFARRWGIGMLAVDTIARYRRIHRVSLVSETHLPTPEATFKLLHYREIATNLDYLALVLGDIQTPSPTLVRLHSACTTGDIFGSQRCDCQAQMQAALHTISAEGRGVLIYLPQEGRGIGLAGKLQAYRLQEQGYDTIEANEHIGYPADARTYSSAVEVLRDLGVTSVRLMTNNPEKLRAVSEQDIDVQRIPLEMQPTDDNRHYLLTKQRRFGHLLTSLSEVQAAL
jgi:3,4-dihydroxy 2-butanone 4-phosphate synthase/GTP cyclohydrolase II